MLQGVIRGTAWLLPNLDSRNKGMNILVIVYIKNINKKCVSR